ncbi:hypothetical protein PR003_g19844 [Phytophthora rubi]|uniref:Uncharacterized protein n=1 Tax=Phytophthora rubi TaxID=129364 RepID=A0A6A4DTE9_9STRA|nr:hypothetical protein PR003_g19844 [Phytophthora rubi]
MQVNILSKRFLFILLTVCFLSCWDARQIRVRFQHGPDLRVRGYESTQHDRICWSSNGGCYSVYVK